MIKPTPIDFALFSGLALVFAAGLVLVPPGTVLPVHWGPSGEADGFLPREAALAVPLALGALPWIVAAVVGRVAPDRLVGGRHLLAVTLTAITAIALAIGVVQLLIGLGVEVGMVRVLALALGLMFVLLGNALPKSQPNSFAGIRLPTTLADPANWQATHRITGLLWMAGGAVLVAAAVIAPPAQLLWWMLGCVAAPSLAGIAYSLIHARRGGRV